MGLDPFASALVMFGALGAGVLLWLGRPDLLSGGRGRLPRRFEVTELDGAKVPLDARQPLAYLAERLGRLGFVPADLPMAVPTVTGWGRRLLLAPFVHPDEHALFVMGIEARWVGGSPLMLHVVTPLKGNRRVETSTLPGLRQIARPPGVDARVVLDAATVEELWSRHRLALNHYERAERQPVAPEDWRRHAAAAYESWLQVALHDRRLRLEATGEAYVLADKRRRWV